jgi:multimeric flavodoxin WrbA
VKVLALNGSPRMRSSSTYHILAPLLEGMESAGAETEVVHLRKLDLRACIGCYSCWVRTPGKCIFDDKDKMASLIDKYNQADLVVFGTPLYHFSMSGIMKDFIDRTLVRLEPWLIPHPDIDGATYHPERSGGPSKMMLVSPCGFPEIRHFDSLVATFRQFAAMERMDYLGEILRPGGETLSSKAHQPLFGEYYQKLRVAGRELIEDGVLSEASQVALVEDLFPVEKEVFYSLAEGYWTEQMDRFKVPEEARHVAPVLASDRDKVRFLGEFSAEPTQTEADADWLPNEELAQRFGEMYRGEVLPDLRATIQLEFIDDSGDADLGPAHWFLDISEGECRLHQGVTPVPTLTIHTPNDLWFRIGHGDICAETAFTDGLFEAEGSMTLLGMFAELFDYPKHDTAA